MLRVTLDELRNEKESSRAKRFSIKGLSVSADASPKTLELQAKLVGGAWLLRGDSSVTRAVTVREAKQFAPRARWNSHEGLRREARSTVLGSSGARRKPSGFLTSPLCETCAPRKAVAATKPASAALNLRPAVRSAFCRRRMPKRTGAPELGVPARLILLLAWLG